MGYSNSSLVSYTRISPNRTSPRNHKIDTITIHCYVGQVTAKEAGAWFAKPAAQASCNYVVDKNGKIGLIVEEKDRSWCTSSRSNDHRAVTIEVACNKTHPYAVNSITYHSLIELIADICKRNHIKELKWKADRSLIGNIEEQNMTVHRWFKNKVCPGEYLYNRHGEIAREVNQRLGVSQSTPAPNQPSSAYGDYSLIFDAGYYAKKYADLRAAFGNNLPKYYQHYCQYGHKEKRKAYD